MSAIMIDGRIVGCCPGIHPDLGDPEQQFIDRCRIDKFMNENTQKETLKMENEIETLKTGDVVQLKSGGPKMTIGAKDAEYGYDNYRCHWFSENHLQTATISISSLKLFVEPTIRGYRTSLNNDDDYDDPFRLTDHR